MAQLNSVISCLDSLLRSGEFADSAYNGLQVDGGESDVRLVAYAVDSGLSVIEAAVKAEADLLIVHHGLMWGGEQAVVGPYGKKVELLMRHHCSLYASHLPLDAHREVGNGFELARHIGLENLEPFCQYKGQMIGAKGMSQKSQPLEKFIELAKTIPGALEPVVLPFGKREIQRVGIVTGSGSFAIHSAAQDGLDLLISGEAKQEAYHLAKELKVNAIFAGHYATETFGVSALARRLQKDFDVKTIFIDEPTGI